MVTWHPSVWKLKQKPLTPNERSLLDGAYERIRTIFREMGLCACGARPATVGNHDRCATCWQPGE